MPEPIHPSPGWGVLHLFLRIDRAAAAGLPASAGKDLVGTFERLAEEPHLQLHLFSVLGHKADVMVFALSEDLTALRRLQTQIAACEFGPALHLTWSYVSLTEVSEYTPTADSHRAELAAKGIHGDDLERRVEAFAGRMAGYNRHRLYPHMPPWEVACFYPMSHRRQGDDNWYRLSFEDRQRRMHEHGRSGRAYTGRVLQLVTASTGLDDWEFGVTLFAHNVADLKDIVYQLRFDDASARYADFGPFVFGLRRTPGELGRELGVS